MPGVATEMMLIPDKGAAIVVLCNSWSNAVVEEVADHIAKTILPDWRTEAHPTLFPHPQTPFSPQRDLVGRWVGTVTTPDGDRVVEPSLPKEGPATARVAGASPAIVDAPAFSGGELTGQFNADLHVTDLERFRHTLHIDLRLEGDWLRGGIVAMGDPKDPYIVAGLTFFTQLRRAP